MLFWRMWQDVQYHIQSRAPRNVPRQQELWATLEMSRLEARLYFHKGVVLIQIRGKYSSTITLVHPQAVITLLFANEVSYSDFAIRRKDASSVKGHIQRVGALRPKYGGNRNKLPFFVGGGIHLFERLRKKDG